MQKTDCIFCQIVAGNSPAHTIWESDTHLAFLSIFPNTEGFSVVIPKEHQGSYIFEQDDAVVTELMLATKRVAQLLDTYYEDVERCGMFFEGYGVDHLHSKIYPMHGTASKNAWEPKESGKFNQFFEKYPGYLCSNNSDRADDEQLADLAKQIRESR
ncbi:MAG: HIT family protein [Microgenomates group bacterium]